MGFAHQSNLIGPANTGSSNEGYVVLTFLQSVLDQYRAWYAVPIEPMTDTKAADVLAKNAAWAGAQATGEVSASDKGWAVVLSNSGATAATVPVTVPALAKVGGVPFGDVYGTTRSAWVTVPAGGSVQIDLADPPGAPTAMTAAAGNASATVSWSAPASDGGAAVTGYRVTTYVGGIAQGTTDAGNATSIVVGGLMNGTAYTFSVAAGNGVGYGPESVQTDPCTPMTVSGAPTAVTAAAGNASATVSWSAPASDGGAAVTGYRVTTYVGGIAQGTTDAGNATSIVVTGLMNGTAYTFSVAAANGIGYGPESAQTAVVTPMTVSGAPTGVTAAAGNASATVSWSAPASDGGAAVTGYRVTTYVGGIAQGTTDAGNATSIVVTGLMNGTAYTFSVAAANGIGYGPESAQTAVVTPVTVPGAPFAVAAAAGNASAVVSWSAPASDGGTVVLRYVVTPYIGSAAQPAVTTSDATTSLTITGLTNGVTFTFTVAAVNAVGSGPESVASPACRPTAGSPPPPSPLPVQRISGNDRYATAVAISQQRFPAGGAGAVVLTRGDLFPDALVATVLAVKRDAPLLLTTGSSLLPIVEREITRVLPPGRTVYIVGGTAAVPASVATRLASLHYQVVRYGGVNRYATAVAVADAVGAPSTVFLATGTAFPDALTAGVAAAKVGGVVLLTDGATMSAQTKAYLASHPGRTFAVGGPAATADRAAVPLLGADRYETAAVVARTLFAHPDAVGVATGTTFADGLAGGALLGQEGGALVLSTSAALPACADSYLAAAGAGVRHVYLFGGESALGLAVERHLTRMLGG